MLLECLIAVYNYETSVWRGDKKGITWSVYKDEYS